MIGALVILFLAFVISVPGHAYAGGYTFTRIVDTTAEFERLGISPIMNGSGRVAFWGVRRLPDGSSAEGIFTSDGSSVTTIASLDAQTQLNSLAPYAFINSSGRVAFRAQVTGGQQAIFTGTGGELTSIVTGQNIDVRGITDENVVAVLRRVPSEAILAGDGATSAAVVYDTAGPLSDIGEQVQVDNVGTFFFNASLDSGVSGIFSGAGGASPMNTIVDSATAWIPLLAGVSHHGKVVFLEGDVGRPDSRAGVFVWDGARVVMIADIQGPFARFHAATINDSGRVAFLAVLDDGGMGVFTGQDPLVSKIIATGDPLFGSTVVSLSLAAPSVGESGQLSFWAMLADGTQGIYRADPPDPVPTVLVHGFCGSPASFGEMAELLRTDLSRPVLAFDYSDASGISPRGRRSIQHVATEFGRFLARIPDLQSVDIVAHSMGGLVVRAWMAGLTLLPAPADMLVYRSGLVRRIVFAATPHYGVNTGVPKLRKELADRASPNCDNAAAREGQSRDLQFSSRFLRTLHEQWEAERNSFPAPEELLFLVGCGPVASRTCGSDGTRFGVFPASAVLPEVDTSQVRYVAKAHMSLSAFDRTLVQGIVDVRLRDDPTYRLVAEFLSSGAVLDQREMGFEVAPARSIVIIEMITESLSPYSGKVYHVDLRECGAVLADLYFPYPPRDRSGWYTVSDVAGGEPSVCRSINIDIPDNFHDPIQFQLAIRAGRPTVVGPIGVIRKRK